MLGWPRVEQPIHLPNDITRTALDHSTVFKLWQQKKRVAEISCDFIGSHNKIGQVR